jgi:FkbM family methyltransferase
MFGIGRWFKRRFRAMRGPTLEERVNRAMTERGLRLYRYVPEQDRLVPYFGVPEGGFDRWASGEFDSDRWHEALERRAIRADVIFDVGVNYGYTSAWFARWAQRVYAFEPNPKNQSLIREQLRIRAIDNVELVETAVSDREGEAEFFVKPQDGHHSLGDIGASETIDRIRVPVTTLDRFATERGIDRIGLLKIDVEGYEAEVLRGARELLAARRIDLILFEYSPGFYRQRGIDPLAPLDLLDDYRVTDLDGAPVDRETIAEVWQVDLLAEK